MEELLEQIQDCENRSEKLTEWERTFIQSISEQLSRRGQLTPKQEEHLNCIWERVTTSGAVAKRGK